MDYEIMYVVLASGESLHPGDRITGFEVIQSKLIKGDNHIWVVLLPTRFNERTIVELGSMLDRHFAKEIPLTIVRATPGSQHQSEFGNIAIEVAQVVDDIDPSLHTFYFTPEGGPIPSMSQCYELIKCWSYTQNPYFITFSNFSCRHTEYPTDLVMQSYSSSPIGQMKIEHIQLGVIGLRTIPLYNGDMRVAAPDIIMPTTLGYLDTMIGRFVSSDDPHWRHYPTLVKAKELGMTSLGLPELQIEHIDTNGNIDIVKRLFQRAGD